MPRRSLNAQKGTGNPERDRLVLTPQTAEVIPLTPAATEFVKFEKNLVSLGFFSPSSKRAADAKPKKVTIVRVMDGQRVEGSVTITPGYIQGEAGQPERPALPATADQDKYLAFHKLLMERRRTHGVITNPIQFSSAELLRELGIDHHSGKNLKEVSDWLDVMSTAAVLSKGVVYLAGRKRWATDRFRVFDRAVSVGEEYEEGRTAETNLVWLSEWQLENINSNFTLPVDFDTYRQLKNHIAKALVPLLQVWLYASRNAGCFEKRYEELCQILSLSEFKAKSRIRQQLGKSLDELQAHHYLRRWDVQRTSDRRGFKVLLWHGEKFYRDRLLREGQAADADEETSRGGDEGQETLVSEERVARLVSLGVSRREAPKILARCGQQADRLDEQIEYLEWYIPQRQGGGSPIHRPGGFVSKFLRVDEDVPASFESTLKQRQRADVQAEQSRRSEEDEKWRKAYEEYVSVELNRHIAEHYPADRYAALLAEEKAGALRADPRLGPLISHWSEAVLREWLKARVDARVRRELNLLSPMEFRAQRPAPR